jgi:hypothetical protein
MKSAISPETLFNIVRDIPKHHPNQHIVLISPVNPFTKEDYEPTDS